MSRIILYLVTILGIVGIIAAILTPSLLRYRGPGYLQPLPYSPGTVFSGDGDASELYAEHNTEDYDPIVENSFKNSRLNPLSTFAIDVDTASYSNVRRFLEIGQLPPRSAVRIEELVNYFTYDYPEPSDGRPFSLTADVTPCPWKSEHRLVHIGLRGRSVPEDELPPRNLVLLLDVSGSMNATNKLPLVQASMRLLAEQLDEQDRVAIVVYAGAAGLVLPPTSGAEKSTIQRAIGRLKAGGSTAGSAGIELAYEVARESYLEGGINRVVLATDGDFNVGVSSRGGLADLIEGKRESGIFLTVLGFGIGNLNDAAMELLADLGNGNYAYIDSHREVEKIFLRQLSGTLVTIAKDVKIQVEFNPERISAYRLIGYENRVFAPEDFNDDHKDAGELGAGHTVTALYEVVPVGVELEIPAVDPLKYQRPAAPWTEASASGELLSIKLRYKEPTASTSARLELAVQERGFGDNENVKFAAAVAAFGMLLRDSQYKGAADFDMVLELGSDGRGDDLDGARAEFLELVKTARSLMQRQQAARRHWDLVQITMTGSVNRHVRNIGAAPGGPARRSRSSRAATVGEFQLSSYRVGIVNKADRWAPNSEGEPRGVASPGKRDNASF